MLTELTVKVAEEILQDIFGKDGIIYARPLFLKNRTLTVTCSSMEVAQEIRLNHAKIVEQINSKIGVNEVDRIRYLT